MTEDREPLYLDNHVGWYVYPVDGEQTWECSSTCPHPDHEGSVTDDREPDTRAVWLEWRRGGIGASDIGAVCGRNPWSSPLAVYLEKRGEVPPEPENEAMRLGRALEDLVADEFHEQTGLHVTGRQEWCQHPEHDWARCTVDGFVTDHPDPDVDRLGIFESKTTGDLARYVPVPDYVALQVQWQLYVTGHEHAWLAVFGGGYRLSVRVLELERDDHAIALMVKAGAEFWERVQTGDPPAVETFYAGDAATLATTYPEPEPGSHVELGGNGLELVEQLRALKAVGKATAERIETTENAIKALMGDHEAGDVDGETVVTWKATETTWLDTKRLRAEAPHLAAPWMVTSASRRFLVK